MTQRTKPINLKLNLGHQTLTNVKTIIVVLLSIVMEEVEGTQILIVGIITPQEGSIPRVRMVRVKVEVKEKAKVEMVRAKVKQSLPKGSTLTRPVISVA